MESNAISLLTADHRKVERWFAEFQDTTSMSREKDLALDICAAIRIHTEIDREIFYPAFLEATADQYKHHAAIVEEEAINDLIAEIERSSPTEEMFFGKVHVLCEMFNHHVAEEEKARGIFAAAQRSKMDLNAIGTALLRRQSQLNEGLDDASA